MIRKRFWSQGFGSGETAAALVAKTSPAIAIKLATTIVAVPNRVLPPIMAAPLAPSPASQ